MPIFQFIKESQVVAGISKTIVESLEPGTLFLLYRGRLAYTALGRSDSCGLILSMKFGERTMVQFQFLKECGAVAFIPYDGSTSLSIVISHEDDLFYTCRGTPNTT